MSTPQDYKFTIAHVPKLSELPSIDSVLASSRTLIESVTNWKQGKALQHGNIKIFSRPKEAGDGAGWHCRVSEHSTDDVTFDELWKYLGLEHAIHEKEYIKVVKKATLIKEVAPSQSVWSMYYEFPTFGVSPRVFTALQVSHLEENEGRRTGWFIQIPVDLSDDAELAQMEEKGTKGKYTSVERFIELENGKVEWRMATSSTPGGRLPSFIVESSMASQIAADVPHFMTWLRSIRKSGETANAQSTPTTAPAADASNAEDAMDTVASAPTDTTA